MGQMLKKVGIEPLPRAKGVSDRVVILSLGARFTDELLSGLPTVLLPTIRATFGLSYSQIGLLNMALFYTAAVIEPVAGLLIDLWKRKWLMAWGAAGIGLATAIIGLAPTFTILILGFIVYGLASGPLAHTADVVLVESYPQTPDRIYSRSTMIDTTGALLAPLLVSATFWLELAWERLLLLLGLSTLIYAFLILRTRFPAPANDHKRAGLTFRQALRLNVNTVLTNTVALTWLLFLFVHRLAETPIQFATIWLREEVGMSQALIGIYIALQMAVSIISLLFLDRWLARSGFRQILIIVSFGVLLLYPIWLFLPGIWTRFLLGLPLTFLFTMYWPIARAQSLASVPGRGGTITAFESLLGLVPVALLFGFLAEAISLEKAMLWVTLGSILILILISLRLPETGQDVQA